MTSADRQFPLPFLPPLPETDVVEAAHAAGRAFTATLSRQEQRTAGQFMTPPAIARFMARRLVAGFERRHVWVLEPAAGAGVLAAAVVEALRGAPQPPERIELLLFETDGRLLPMLETLCRCMAAACAADGITLDWTINGSDFLLSALALGGQRLEGLLTIANPPFFKLNKTNDVRAAHHAYAVHGQPNIYGLFMACAARLTPPGGRWCFITPRSWMNGSYFKAVRQTLLRHLAIDHLHAFESRTDSFGDDAVLQETVITWATGRTAAGCGEQILLTRSQGADDLDAAVVQALPAARVLAGGEHATLALPASEADPLRGWSATLATHGLQVSTGPVVAFRAANHLREAAEDGTVPLLWLQHVGQQAVRWPIRKKREHLLPTAANAWMLVVNAPMVLMRRFSPKEDARRVTCAPYLGGLPGAVLGLENHLNFIHRPGGRMSPDEVRGLSALLASSVVDAHFRALAGSTQVNATELRRLPLPPLDLVEAIGRALPATPGLVEIDAVVNAVLGLDACDRTAA